MTTHYGDYPELKLNLDAKNHCLWITLNRPDARNALSTPMIQSLVTVLAQADRDPMVRVMVLTGAGDSFCAGGDIKQMQEQSGMFGGNPTQLRDQYQQGIQQIPLAMEALKTPIIGMINGPAIGAGCDLAAMCDLRIAGPRAKFGETFSQMGLVPGDGGPYFLVRLIGYGKAMEMYLTGKIYSGTEALSMNLVNQVAASDQELYDKCLQLAQSIAAKAPLATEMTKKSLQYASQLELRACLDLMASYQAIVQRTQDHQEALSAFKGKRAAQFKRD